ncbi:alpha/beta hydrolase [Pseudoclavibacter helvolus]|uniref:Alpha-beta hydrolase superfamily lysophospholipase n=1 Tax=Pseudoclavibacter helvolus TaxID=255205 RepID=A0A7W4YDW4_9MICO|nr:alpha-beta hydrolase superfamily lysophospholipase [Pseudoclavibacter helvolus]
MTPVQGSTEMDFGDSLAAATAWRPDVLGAGFSALDLPLKPDHEGEVLATLVRGPRADRFARGAARGADVLYVHGWSDYFFQKHHAHYWAGEGARFFALDLRKYGRSLRDHQTPGFVTDLATYDEELDRALEVMGHGPGGHRRGRHPLILIGHSTGGLTLSLWADRHPGRADALILNSPWLELQTRAAVRTALTPLMTVAAQLRPTDTFNNIDFGFYTRAVKKELGGEWEFDDRWRPTPSFTVRAGWLNAILAGHAAVAVGLDIKAPVLTMLSSRSTLSPIWHESMRRTDSVLRVDDIARRSLNLGDTVTVRRLNGALHDVLLSAPEVRAKAFEAMTRWLKGYLS